jgi:ABC-2 type transport system ATP-binding protein
MIEFIGITKKFKSDFWKKYQTVLDDFSFKIEEGSLCGFLGANGAGKTTSIKLLLQFIFPNSGEIIFDKSLGCDFNQIRRNIGYFPERPFFLPLPFGKRVLPLYGKFNGDKVYRNR